MKFKYIKFHNCSEILIIALIAMLSSVPARAGSLSGPAVDSNEPLVRLSFPPNIELQVLIDYVAERMGMNILYREEMGRARVTLKTPTDIPISALPGILESSLRMNGLALVDAEQPGWQRIVVMQGMAAATQPIGKRTQAANAVVTQVIEIVHADPLRIESILRPFLTPQGANVIVDNQRRLLVLTDFSSQVELALSLIDRLDQPTIPPTVAFVTTKHASAATLAQTVSQLLEIKQRIIGSVQATSSSTSSTAFEVTVDDRSNRIIVTGSQEIVDSARLLISQLDVDLGLETRVYAMSYVSAERLDALIKRLIDPLSIDRLYISTVDHEGNCLVISATPVIHDKVAELRHMIDVPLTEADSPVRFYKLQNADAAEVLATIRAIEGETGMEGVGAIEPSAPSASASATASPVSVSATQSQVNDYDPTLTFHLSTVHNRDATVTADKNLNSIIVVADPTVQRVYESLIAQLDQRRPQVMIEATIVTLDTTGGFTLGVEISGGDFSGDFQSFTFSQFGLSEISDTGRLDLIPGVGFNGAVLSADIADIVIQALKTEGRTSVVSAPKILVNDNATGTISSVAEAPVASINQGQNSDTVSFSGFVEAGTTISVTPQIAEGDHLRLEFEVALESFTGESSTTLPPPRSSNTVSSEVTIPDGATIVVGGINRKDLSESVSRIPILGEIPLLEYLFSSRSSSESESTLFVFLKPVILRDDRFADLKFYSTRDTEAAGLPSEFPISQPMLIRPRPRK